MNERNHAMVTIDKGTTPDVTKTPAVTPKVHPDPEAPRRQESPPARPESERMNEPVLPVEGETGKRPPLRGDIV